MAEEWLTYSDLGERLGISSEAARQKAIRHRWRRRTNNHGKAEVLVDLIEAREHMERFPPRKPKAEQPDNDSPTPEEQQSDARTFEALEAHIATLKEIVAKAEGLADRERARADEERGRADAERSRADSLQARIDALTEERVSDAQRMSEVEQAVSDLRSKLAERAAYDARPWWKKIAG
jgi:chromosome segregation ATPase